MTNFPQQLKGIAISTVFFFGLLYVQAWTGAPAGIPPANNVDAPINVGVGTQYKPGSLGIGGLLKVYGTFNIPTGAGTGKVLTSDSTGNASWVVPTTNSPSGTHCGAATVTRDSELSTILSVTNDFSCNGSPIYGGNGFYCPSGYSIYHFRTNGSWSYAICIKN